MPALPYVFRISLMAAAMMAAPAVWADMQGAGGEAETALGAVSGDMTDVAADVGGISAATFAATTSMATTEAATGAAAIAAQATTADSAVSVLQNQLNALKAQPRTAQTQASIAGLEGIIAKLQQGYTIQDYVTSTDASSMVNTTTITFGKGGATTTLKIQMPPVVADNDSYGTGSGTDSGSAVTSSGGSEAADMLTQLLQQAGSGMNIQMPNVTNPLGNIQSTLNNLVTAGANPTPVPPASECAADDGKDKQPGSKTAVYDISAGKVYMPDGSVLEAHSGMGQMMDNPAYVNQRMNGPTPPNTYNLTMRESPYYGVEALRMTPTDPGSMYGRDGILAHSKLVRGNNGSHGCVAFANYPAFLAAYKAGQVKQIVVVPKKAGGEGQKKCEAVNYSKAAETGTSGAAAAETAGAGANAAASTATTTGSETHGRTGPQ